MKRTGSRGRVAMVAMTAVAVMGLGRMVEAQQTPEGFAGGTGVVGDPWIIETAEQLALVREHTGVGREDNHFKLGADINLNENYTDSWKEWGTNPPEGLVQWEAIGNSDTPFTGVFDGAGFVVRGVYIDNEDLDTIGFFGYVNHNGEIMNLGVEESFVRGKNYVGGLVGGNDGGDINNSYSTGNVEGSGEFAGGLAGGNRGIISNSYATGNVEGNEGVGGLVGGNIGTISGSYATGDVSGNSDVGGLTGVNSNIIENCAALNSNVIGIGDVGRVVGFHYDFYYTVLDANIAFAGMSVTVDGVSKSDIGNAGDHIDGASRTRAALYSSTGWPVGFDDGLVWEFAEGKLPRLVGVGNVFDLPTHLQPKALAITGVTAADREYDGTETIALAGGELRGVDDGCEVGFTLGDGTMDDADAGVGKAVATGISLTGADAAGYTLVQPAVTVDIKPKQITITPDSGQSKIYGEADPSFTFTCFPALIDGDRFTGSLGRYPVGEEVGIYEIVLNDLSAGGNYSHNFISGITFEIMQTSGIAEADKTISIDPSGGSAAVAPIPTLAAEFTAGPNPASKAGGAVSFFYQGKRIDNGSLIIYDISGNFIREITIADNSTLGQFRRIVGVWDFKDARGRTVGEGTYLIRAAITVGGKTEKVSLMVGVVR